MSLGFERLNSCRNSKWDFLFKNGTKKGEKQMKKVWTWKNTKNDINFRKNIYSKIAWQMAIGTPIILDHIFYEIRNIWNCILACNSAIAHDWRNDFSIYFISHFCKTFPFFNDDIWRLLYLMNIFFLN